MLSTCALLIGVDKKDYLHYKFWSQKWWWLKVSPYRTFHSFGHFRNHIYFCLLEILKLSYHSDLLHEVWLGGSFTLLCIPFVHSTRGVKCTVTCIHAEICSLYKLSQPFRPKLKRIKIVCIHKHSECDCWFFCVKAVTTKESERLQKD